MFGLFGSGGCGDGVGAAGAAAELVQFPANGLELAVFKWHSDLSKLSVQAMQPAAV
jgi:hypothetical protein